MVNSNGLRINYNEVLSVICSYSGNNLEGTNSSLPPSPTSPPKKKSSNIGIVIAAVAGGIAGLAIVLGILIWYFCSKKKKVRQETFSKEVALIPGMQNCHSQCFIFISGVCFIWDYSFAF